MDPKVRETLESFFCTYRQLRFKKGEMLLQGDRDPAGIFYLTKGIVRTYSISKNGEELTLNIYKPYSFFPMSYAMSNIHNKHYYEAMTEVVVHIAPKEDTLDFIVQHKEVIYDLLRRMYTGIEGVFEHIESLMSGDSSEKLIAVIRILSNRFGREVNGGGRIIALKMTEKDIASYAGMSRETVSRQLQVLKRKKLITYHKGVLEISNAKMIDRELL